MTSRSAVGVPLTYFKTIGLDTLAIVKNFVIDLSSSFKFFDLMAYLTLLTFIYLSFQALSFRIKIPLSRFYTHFSGKSLFKGVPKEEGMTLFIIKELLTFWFEGLLIVSLVLEFILGYALGWLKALPFILLSLLNIALWLYHINKVTLKEKVRP